MKPGWKYCQLEDAVIKGSSNISLNKVKGEAGKYALFAAQGFVQNVSFFHQEQEYLAIIKDGAGIGRVTKYPAKSSVVATMQYLIPKDGFDIDFIKYFLEAIDFEKYRRGSTIPHVYFKDYKSEKFPKLPLSEQQRIVSIIDECIAVIDKVKANAERNLFNTDELFENSVQAIFTAKGIDWEEKMLGELAAFRNGLNYSKGSKGEIIKIVGVKDFQNSYWVSDYNLDEVSIDGFLNKSDLLKEGDILAVRSNGNPQLIGRTLLAGKVKGKVSHSGFTIRIRLNSKKVIPNYLCHYLKIQSTRKRLVESGNGVGIKSLNQGSLSSLKIPFPKSIKEQKEIIEKIDLMAKQTKRLKAIYQKKIDGLEGLRKSILRKAFEGKLSSSIPSNIAIPKNTPLDKVEGISPTDLQAGITAIALKRHAERNHQHSFHHVKVEKIVHLTEYILNIDLERNPVKDAAGPNDFPHAKKVESRARKAGYYTVFKNGEFYDYKEGSKINSVIQKAHNSLGGKVNILFRILDILVPLNTQQAEVVATVYAAWNNLLKSRKDFSDEEIVKEAREDWHAQKLKIPRDRFFNALEWMKKQELLVPTGNGKLVIPK